MNKPPLAHEIEPALPWRHNVGTGLRASLPLLLLLCGIASLVIPTIRDIARVSWDSEQGAHGPIVLAIAVWLFISAWPAMKERAQPGSAFVGGASLLLFLAVFLSAHIVGSVMIQSAALYGVLVSILYLIVGWAAIRTCWFPIAYFLFVLPPPGSLVALATQPLRLEIASAGVAILSWFGMPVAREGLLIYVGQYELEVKAACGGLNSIISLSAVGLFYAYALHRMNLRYCLVLAAASVVLAIIANLLRVILLMLMTYYLGDKTAQGFLHGAAGIFMFVVALAGLFVFDHFAAPLRRALS